MKGLPEFLDSKFIDEFIWVSPNLLSKNVLYRQYFFYQLKYNNYNVSINPVFSRNFYLGDDLIRITNSYERIGQKGSLHNTTPELLSKGDTFYTKLIDTGNKSIFEFERNKIFFSNLLQTEITIEKPTIEIEPNNQLNKIVFFPGAFHIDRQWAPEKFSALASYLIQKYNTLIYICGSLKDKEISMKICKNCPDKIFDLCGKLTFGELIHFVGSSKLTISNESFGAHLSILLNIKTICIFNGKEPVRYMPYPAKYKYQVIDINNTHFSDYIPGTVNAITIESVIKAADTFLDTKN
ncbi:MAG: glycosyltransferase family 9 protein [Bacteroidota bacterium]|nr:glycosyltransferase family 9 protein [Bacteroidota bacterium]